MNYPDTNGGVSSPYGSDLNPFDQPFGGRPAMTSSQQDIRPAPPHGGPVGYPGGPTGGGVRMPYPDERMSDRGSSVPNPLDERLSEPESSVAGYGGDPAADPRYARTAWRPNDNMAPLYDQGQSDLFYRELGMITNFKVQSNLSKRILLTVDNPLKWISFVWYCLDTM